MKKRYNDALELITKRWWVVVIIAMLLTFALSLFMGLGQSIWFDEGYSILLAKHSVGELFALTNVDAHPALYYLVLKAWAGLFGWSELALRSLSALFAALTVGAGALVLRKLFTTRIMLVVLPFIVLSPLFLRYGYEIRMYTLAALIGMIATWALLRAVEARTSKLRWITYGALVALGMYTLYMTLVIWLAHAVWLVLQTKDKRQLLKQPFVGAYGVAIILFIPQLIIFVYQLFHSALPGVGVQLTLSKLVSVLTLSVIYTPEWNIDGWQSLILLAGMILFGIGYITAMRDKRHGKSIAFLAVLVLVPLAFYAITSLPPRQPMFVDRYLAHVVLFGFMLMGAVVSLNWINGRRKLAVWLGIIVIGMSSFGLYRLYQTGNFNFERMQKPMTQELRADIPCGKDATIVADDPYTYIDSVYYFENCDLHFYSTSDVLAFGGYAPLHGSDKRIASPADITTRRIVHMYWTISPATFTPDAAYHLISSHTYDKQVVDIYER